jgi:hypothetical protein
MVGAQEGGNTHAVADASVNGARQNVDKGRPDTGQHLGGIWICGALRKPGGHEHDGAFVSQRVRHIHFEDLLDPRSRQTRFLR